MSERWYAVGDVGEFGEDEPTCRTVEEHDVAVFRVGEKFFALADRCTHGDARLSEGWVEDGCVECPLHQARFNLATGVPETGPAYEPVRAFPIRVVEGIVEVGI